MNIIQFSEADQLLDIRYDFVFKAELVIEKPAREMVAHEAWAAFFQKICPYAIDTPKNFYYITSVCRWHGRRYPTAMQFL